ncbi:MAG: class I SAM-dependent methyltransferase, partial [Firmicutes bacterium]|nr:class I SAM-dependent methyltransferase [Bacillota bacterium]
MEKKGPAREQSVSQKAYHSESYLGKKQWDTFLFQIKTIYKELPPPTNEHSILEIGYGSGFTNVVLKELGYAIESLDINNNLNPTYVGDISTKNFHLHKKYDCILCAEVLEHIPFEKFDIC